MRKFHYVLFCICLLWLPFIAQAQNFGGNPAGIKWKQVQQNNLRVIFPAGLDSQARRVLQVNSLLNDVTLSSIGSKMRKWDIVLQNKTTISNAYVRLAPAMSEYYLTPDQDNFSNGSLRWDDNLAIHENRHMQQFSNFNKGLTRVFSFLLGQEGQLLANGITIPDYFFEGDAVYQETLVSQQGRGRMPSFYNGIKSLWLQDKSYSWMKLRSGSLKDYTPGHYEIGYLLTGYGYEKFGDDFWRKVTDDAVRFKGLFYAFNKAIERHSGVPYRQFRQDAMAYYKKKTNTSSASTKAYDNYLTPTRKNNVVSYNFPAIVSKDTLLVTRSAYNEINSFYFIINGKEQKLRVKDFVLDDYFSYRNGKLVYSAYRSDALRANRDYSEIRLLDIHTNQQKNLTSKTKYFSPDINEAGTRIVAVNVAPDGSNQLHELDVATGSILHESPNPENYFFTQTKYINDAQVVSAVRQPDGKMALVKITLESGGSVPLTPFSYNVLGYPFVKNDTIYYSMMYNSGAAIADMLFAVDLASNKQFQLTENVNGMYQPVVTGDGRLISSAFTADGYRLTAMPLPSLMWKPVAAYSEVAGVPFAKTSMSNTLFSDSLAQNNSPVSSYRKTVGLFNFHSARPFISGVEYGYSFYGDNVLSSFGNSINYVYNRNERSSAIGYQAVYSGAFPFFTAGLEYTYNRNIDTALNRGINFNAARANLGMYVPLRFVGGKTFKNLLLGGAYNVEQIPYIGIGKNVWQNNSFKYMNAFLSFSNRSRMAIQHINPRWAQALSLSYRQAFNYFETKKLTGNASLFLPGIFTNHSLVLNGALQVRDTLPDLFSNNYNGARGYEALNTRRMYKAAVNYHLPLLYPDLGVGNILFVQRIRVNTFFDYNISRARLSGKLTNIKYRSTGAELYFDGKLWNALDAGIGVRYSHLLDTDLQFPAAKGRWEIILPINIIPN